MKFVKEKTGLYKLEGKGIPETYLMHSEPSQQILLHPEIAGKELKELAIKANAEFIKKAYPICLKGKRIDKICELVLMCGGNYYGTREAFENEFNASLRQAFIGVKRYQEDSKWKAAIGYSNFEALPDDATVIIADTIATGSTLKEAIVELGRQAEKKNYNLDSIIVYTLAVRQETQVHYLT